MLQTGEATSFLFHEMFSSTSFVTYHGENRSIKQIIAHIIKYIGIYNMIQHT